MLNPIMISDELNKSGHCSYIDKTGAIIWQVQDKKKNQFIYF